LRTEKAKQAATQQTEWNGSIQRNQRLSSPASHVGLAPTLRAQWDDAMQAQVSRDSSASRGGCRGATHLSGSRNRRELVGGSKNRSGCLIGIVPDPASHCDARCGCRIANPLLNAIAVCAGPLLCTSSGKDPVAAATLSPTQSLWGHNARAQIYQTSHPNLGEITELRISHATKSMIACPFRGQDAMLSDR
jgi:hypothetical protein